MKEFVSVGSIGFWNASYFKDLRCIPQEPGQT